MGNGKWAAARARGSMVITISQSPYQLVVLVLIVVKARMNDTTLFKGSTLLQHAEKSKDLHACHVAIAVIG